MIKLLTACVRYMTQCVVWTVAFFTYDREAGADECPHCGRYYDWMDERYFTQIASGSHAPPGDVTIHWVRGISRCPHCGHAFEWEDSD